jgi:hypothetical protein
MHWALSASCSPFFTCCPLQSAQWKDGWTCSGSPVVGGNVFDLQLVAAMQANNVDRIYTYNADDFRVFPELVVVIP